MSDEQAVAGNAGVSVAARVPRVSTAGPDQAVADDRAGEASPDRWRSRSSAAEVLAATKQLWNLDGPLPIPYAGKLRCGSCGQSDPLIRCWQFHRRPGAPTVPWRCDVHVKCSRCAAGWWHGVALDFDAWRRRPRPEGIRSLLLKGSNFEPKIWNGDR